MHAIRRLPIWLISVGCITVGIVNRVYYDDPSENRIQGWQYYQSTVSDWYLAGMLALWAQLVVWCVVGVARVDRRWGLFVGGIILSGFLTLALTLYCVPEYLFH